MYAVQIGASLQKPKVSWLVITEFTSQRTNLSPFTKGCREWDASMWLTQFLGSSELQQTDPQTENQLLQADPGGSAASKSELNPLHPIWHRLTRILPLEPNLTFETVNGPPKPIPPFEIHFNMSTSGSTSLADVGLSAIEWSASEGLFLVRLANTCAVLLELTRSKPKTTRLFQCPPNLYFKHTSNFRLWV